MAVNLEQVCAAFIAIERKLDLMEREIEGVRAWPVARFHAFMQACQRGGLYMPPNRRGRPIQRVLRNARKGLAGLTRTPALARGHAENLVLPHPRKLAGPQGWRDPIIGALLAELAGSKTLVIDRDEPGGPPRPAHYDLPMIRREGFDLRAAAAIRLARPLPPEAAWVVAADIALRERLGYEIGLPALMTRNLAKFTAHRRHFGCFVRRLGAKRVFIVVAYTNEGFVAGARDAGAQVIELQHGSFSPLELAYHYPGRPKNPYAPDLLLTFGEFWSEGLELPANTDARVIGSTSFARTAVPSVARQSGRLLFLSQGTVDDRLVATAVEVARLMPGAQIHFRLHPSVALAPFATWLAANHELPPNFTLADSSTALMSELESSDAVVGVYSTAMSEALALGCRVVVMAFPGHEHMQGMLRRGDVTLARDAAGVISALETAQPAARPADYFAPAVPSILEVVKAWERSRAA